MGDLHSMTLIALRYLLIDTLNLQNPMNYSSEEDLKFWDYHFNYLKSLEFDDFAHWTQDDFNYLNERCYDIEPSNVKRNKLWETIFKKAIGNQRVSQVLKDKVFTKANFPRYNHWMSVVLGRSHQMDIR
jgi:hypothetical protein